MVLNALIDLNAKCFGQVFGLYDLTTVHTKRSTVLNVAKYSRPLFNHVIRDQFFM